MLERLPLNKKITLKDESFPRSVFVDDSILCEYSVFSFKENGSGNFPEKGAIPEEIPRDPI